MLLSEKDNDFYIGYTVDLKRRISEHNAKKNFSTKGRVPFCLVYAETCLNEQDAKCREDYLKTTQGGRFIKLRIKEYLKNQEKKNSYSKFSYRVWHKKRQNRSQKCSVEFAKR